MYLASRASDDQLKFNLTTPPIAEDWPRVTWLLPSTPSEDPWEFRSFPQEAWRKHDPECVGAIACDRINIAPSARFAHTAVLYKSWNFERDVKDHPTLCKSVAGPEFWSLPYFEMDDGESFPLFDHHDIECPPYCCGERRMCLRTHDEHGKRIPFDRPYLLVFGGRTFENREYKGKSLYNHCEEILMKEPNIDEELRGCLEYQSEELWRYDFVENRWDFIKPLSSVDDSSGEEVGVPHGRYGHSAAMVILDAVVDPDNVRRQRGSVILRATSEDLLGGPPHSICRPRYMYIYGGMSMNCLNGLCSDMWRIEVPWAPTAYWPTMTPLSEWRSRRPSRWVRMKDCKYGGRFRHRMEAAPSGDLIFVFGGNVVGKWENSLLV
ncbi:hypothetical protein FOZ62_026014 [Perkinsus olseni]|uniref:Uncharacterized protein n=2 Tax=Perkinsus olseni TaxID=32597 RepID=A0A7J6QLU3_PEROL|nr:hypothetical protein FOZ62_026014 [Perkinsus olseni]